MFRLPGKGNGFSHFILLVFNKKQAITFIFHTKQRGITSNGETEEVSISCIKASKKTKKTILK